MSRSALALPPWGGQAPRPVVVVGSGLGGSLLALVLAWRGWAVWLVGPEHPAATGLSYGGLGRAALVPWRALERSHGPLGCGPCRIFIHGLPPAASALPPVLQASLAPPLPFARVDGAALAAALPGALEAAGVRRCRTLVERLEPLAGGGWRLIPAGAAASSAIDALPTPAATVVLAAGVGSRALWPPLPPRLRFSWAGVIVVDPPQLPPSSACSPWLRRALGGGIVRPWQLGRPALEARAASLAAEAWTVDAGLAPRGQQLLLGQITLVGPRLDAAEPPDPAWMERRLRGGLAQLDPRLAEQPGTYRQVAVPYCLDGVPLVGPVQDAAGLWVFTGFRGAFTTVPALAEELADAMERG